MRPLVFESLIFYSPFLFLLSLLSDLQCCCCCCCWSHPQAIDSWENTNNSLFPLYLFLSIEIPPVYWLQVAVDCINASRKKAPCVSGVQCSACDSSIFKSSLYFSLERSCWFVASNSFICIIFFIYIYFPRSVLSKKRAHEHSRNFFSNKTTRTAWVLFSKFCLHSRIFHIFFFLFVTFALLLLLLNTIYRAILREACRFGFDARRFLLQDAKRTELLLCYCYCYCYRRDIIRTVDIFIT